MNRPIFASLAILLLLSIGCGPASPTVESTDTEAAPLSECMSQADLICQSGILGARLGDLVAEATWENAENIAVQDSLESQGGYIWLSRTVHLPDGPIIVEGNFIDERNMSDSLLSESRVNRLRIHNSAFQTTDQLHIGSSVAEIIAAYPAADFGLIPLASYGMLDIQVDTSHIHFLIRVAPELLAQDSLRLESVPIESQVAMIVVM